MTEHTRIGVVGVGQMGRGIAEVFARAGRDVVVTDTAPEALAAAPDRIAASLARAVRKGLPGSTVALDRIRYSADLAGLHDRTLVIEAVAEDEAVKTAVFRELDAVVTDPGAVLASNTSSIPIIRLAMSTRRPDRVVGLHFFNPVPVMDLVEIVPSLTTDPEVTREVEELLGKELGKTMIRASDRAGFVVNALLIPYLLSAIRMLESGFATATAIDAGMRLGCAHPMGPLALTDLIGLDTTAAIAESLYDEFREPHYAPPALLRRMIDAGHVGRKTGQGFFGY
ncbi:3-hydroxybutyryl-CoA dehydrogenase [Streptomyces sp. NPDC001520]|uniref:3-hydroxybutyryl-CoA dehydrogenase n=1 Tax=Streptomyces sp. NPDC001520 TaxID=3364581 RepID=UPI003685BC97